MHKTLQALQEIEETFSDVSEAVLPNMAEGLPIGDSSAVLEALPTNLRLLSSAQALLQSPTATVTQKQHKSTQIHSMSQFSEDITRSLDAALKAAGHASCAPNSSRDTTFTASTGHTAALVKRAVGGGSFPRELHYKLCAW
jgi:hypothetical protein